MAKTYAEALFAKYHGKILEVYLGENTGKVFYSDHEYDQKSVLRGVPVAAIGDMLTLQCYVSTKVKNYTCEIDVNGWAIRGAMPVRDDDLSIMTVFGNFEVHKKKI